MKANKIEIMAPVGNFESLATALKAGCDSVYFGIEQLNMRSRSSVNFTIYDLVEIVAKCKKQHVKTYITLNTILYDHDLVLMRTIVDQAKSDGISAIIASDHSVMAYAKKVQMPIHISTQSNITNIESVEFYSAYADVMVMSRELSLTQVSEITREIERREIKGPSGELVRIEIFAHGALCMAVSGKCYLSLHSHNASANRGACIQNCRKSYYVTDEDGTELKIDNEYIMSAKDLCTIGFIDKIIESGVSILKIEGRGRSVDYVHATLTCYKEAVESISTDSYSKEKIEKWTAELAAVFNRGFWDGYYLGRKLGEWNDAYGSKATEKKVYVGRGLKYYRNQKVGEFQMDSHSLKLGDKILITGVTTGIVKTTISEIRVDDSSVDAVKKGDIFSIPVNEKVRPSDKLYKIIPA